MTMFALQANDDGVPVLIDVHDHKNPVDPKKWVEFLQQELGETPDAVVFIQPSQLIPTTPQAASLEAQLQAESEIRRLRRGITEALIKHQAEGDFVESLNEVLYGVETGVLRPEWDHHNYQETEE